MSPATCPTCGTAHGPERRYCLACGGLVGQRPVDPTVTPTPVRAAAPEPAAAPAATSAPPAPAASPTIAPAPPATAVAPATSAPVAADSLWRRPATSILTAVALATGLTAGFLLEPQGGAAVGPGAAAAAQSGVPAAGTTTTEPAAGGTTTDAPAQAGAPGANDAPPAATDEPADQTGAAPSAAPSTATPQLADATAAPPASGATPATAAPSGTPADSSASSGGAGDTKTAAGGSGRKGKAAAADPKGDGAGAKNGSAPAKRAGDAAGLPRIDHVWAVGIGTPVAPRDGGYLGETLLAAATELPKYAPGTTDPVAGAAALVAGRGPSASATTIAGRLTAAKRRWRAYAPGSPTCTDAPAVNPFLAFGSVTSAASCKDGVAGLDALPADLRDADAAPAFSYVATDPTLDAVGLDAQLRRVVEPIRRSAAFKRSGLIAIVPTSAPTATATGALLLSPFAAGSTAIDTAFGPYALLRTFADLLGVERPGHAADTGVRGLGPEVLTPED